MQVKCTNCGKNMYITRKLLDIPARKLISGGTKKILALLGSLTSFCVSEKILKLMGVKINKMSVWRCTQEVGAKLAFDLDINEKARHALMVMVMVMVNQIRGKNRREKYALNIAKK